MRLLAKRVKTLSFLMSEITLVWAVGEAPRWVAEEASWPGGCTGHLQGKQTAAASPYLREVVKGLSVSRIKTCLSKGIKRLPKWIADGKGDGVFFFSFPFTRNIKKVRGENASMNNPFLFLLQSLFNHCDSFPHSLINFKMQPPTAYAIQDRRTPPPSTSQPSHRLDGARQAFQIQLLTGTSGVFMATNKWDLG